MFRYPGPGAGLTVADGPHDRIAFGRHDHRKGLVDPVDDGFAGTEVDGEL